jgi:glycerol kinase
MDQQYILALDQGTTSSRTIAYNLSGQVVATANSEYQITYPQPGWVEQDPNSILESQLETLKTVLTKIDPKKVVGIGITNQRETVICWDKVSGKALAPAIVWQCRRTAQYCQELKQSGVSDVISKKTGLVIDAYFSASKIKWLIENNKAVRASYDLDQAIFGTVDSWLIYNLTKSETVSNFLTDSSNASRTMLFNLATNDWDQELLTIFGIKKSALCQIKASNSDFGTVQLFGLNAPIMGVLGDQQSSLLGHQAVQKNQIKCTFGTGAFLLKNSGSVIERSQSGLLTTVAWALHDGSETKLTYALEGSVFIAGALIQWLRDKLGMISSSAEIESLALQDPTSNGLILVPAFVGLGAPDWDSSARGTILGLTGDTSRSNIAYAALEAVSHQVADLLDLPELGGVSMLSIDGGMSKNLLFAQILADLTQKQILIAAHAESTAYGAFLMAAFGLKLLDPFQSNPVSLSSIKPRLDLSTQMIARKNWQRAKERAKSWITE